MLATLELYLLFLSFQFSSKLTFVRNRRALNNNEYFIRIVLCVYLENEVRKFNSAKWILFLGVSITKADNNKIFVYVLYIVDFKLNLVSKKLYLLKELNFQVAK